MKNKKNHLSMMLYLLFIAAFLIGFACLVRHGILWFFSNWPEYLVSGAHHSW